MSELPSTTVIERVEVDWERHKGTGAPKIKPPPGVEWRSASGKTRQRHRYFTRVTTYADAISDQYNLMRWKQRRVALGLGQRPDYVRLASALTDRDDDRDALDELVDKALEAAGPNKADEGTALHALFERIDRGEPLGNPPPELVPDLAAYEALSAEAFRWVVRECRTVCDELQVAGTPDGLAHVAEPCPAGCGPEVLHVGDSKTGSIRYPAKMAIQLAIYARSERYSPETGERTPLGGGVEVCTRWGFIVHSPVESGRSAPYWLDLDDGWRGALLCGPVREWNARKADELLVPFREVLPVQVSADGELIRGDVRPASYNPRGSAPAAPAPEVADVTALVEALPPGLRESETTRLLVEAIESEDAADLDGTDDPQPDPTVEAIRRCITDRDLELLWQREGSGWSPEHRELAAVVMHDLRAARDAERPRAALRAAIETAPDVGQLTAIMVRYRDEPWVDDGLRELADTRYWSLMGRRPPPRPALSVVR